MGNETAAEINLIFDDEFKADKGIHLQEEVEVHTKGFRCRAWIVHDGLLKKTIYKSFLLFDLRAGSCSTNEKP